MTYFCIALMAFFFGHAMGRSACLDYFPQRSTEVALWVVSMLRTTVSTSRPIDSGELVTYLESLQDDLTGGRIRFAAARSMRNPCSVVVQGQDTGPITR